MDSNALLKSISKVTQKRTKKRQKEEKNSRAVHRRQEAMIRTRRITIKEAAYRVMESAYLKASSNGKLPAEARQVMYAARGDIQELTGKQLDAHKFKHTLL